MILEKPRSSENPALADLLPNDLVALPPGAFWMGASLSDKFATDTERPRHLVRLSHRFALGEFPVTVKQFQGFRPTHAADEQAELSVVNVSPDDADEYCQWLGSITGKPYRLPSEAEWEYGCRAGTSTPFSTGNGINLTEANYLYSEEGLRVGIGGRTGADAYPSNPYGLRAMHGNVGEMVADHWHPNYSVAPADGSAWRESQGQYSRVIRGGAWDHLPRLLRSSWRDFIPANERRDNIGFRLALTLD